MHIKLFIILVCFFCSCYPHLLVSQDVIQPLSTEEKLRDFEFLYTEFEQSYPYFGVNKRQYEIDWLGNKQHYADKVRATTNDREYIAAIQEIVFELRNGHTDLYPTIMYDYFYAGYSDIVAEHPQYAPMVAEMERFGAKEKAAYWQGLLNELKGSDEEEEVSDEQVTQITGISQVVSGQTLVVNLPSFSYEKIEIDAERLEGFFREAHEYEHLVLNIQGNSGGSETYWHEHIVGHLINEEIFYPIVMGFKKSPRLKRLKPGYEENLTYEALDLPSLPPELSSGDYVFSRDTNSIAPVNDSKSFTGKIYLLVDEAVYSSAESLAYFCKVTGFAEVVGKTTSGDGIGSDPLLLTLPESGIVIRFTGEMGLNPDGSANEETKTVPDVLLPGDTPELRLEQLLEKIGGS